MKKTILLLAAAVLATGMKAADDLTLKSPDGTVGVNVSLGDKVTYTVSVDGNEVLTGCELAMTIGNKQLGVKPKLKNVKRTTVNETIKREVPLKNAMVKNHYNAMTLNMSGNYAIEFRAFDNGVAYRFVTNIKGTADVKDETFRIGFPGDYMAHVSYTDGFKTSYESPYSHIKTGDFKPSDKMIYFPVLVSTDKNYKILISEADLKDYPCMFLKGTGENGMSSVFPKVPLEFGDDGDRSVKILKEADYIARTQGKRSFPWRYFVISKQDKDLLANMKC